MENSDWSNEFEETLINGVPLNKVATSSPSSSSQQLQKTELWNSRSVAGNSWGVTVKAATSPSFIEYARHSSLNANIHHHHNLPTILDQQMMKKPAITTTTTSFDSSLDCLLSASNSLTDTTATSIDQDDGISQIFSDYINQSNSNKRKRSSDNLNFQSNYSTLPQPISSSTINFQQTAEEADGEAIAQMKEIIYRTAAFRPVSFAEEAAERPKRRNVRISKDPQTVAARQRRERISERIRVLQKLVPGGSKMDTASMLDEAANYLKFLRSQIKALEGLGIIDPTLSIFPPNMNFAFSPFINYSFAMQQPQLLIHNPNPVNQSKC